MRAAGERDGDRGGGEARQAPVRTDATSLPRAPSVLVTVTRTPPSYTYVTGADPLTLFLLTVVLFLLTTIGLTTDWLAVTLGRHQLFFAHLHSNA